MGMPKQPQKGMNIAPDGTVYEILDDGTIKRIGKVSSDGSFEPFGGPKDGIRVRDGIIYRVINGKEVKIGRILPNGEIETISQKIKSEADAARNKVKIVTIVSVCCLIAFLAILYSFNSQQQAKVKTAEINARQTEAEAQKAEEERKKEAEKTKQMEAEALKAAAITAGKQADVNKEAEKTKQAEAEAKKAEEERKAKESEAKKVEPKPEPKPAQKKATMSEDEAKRLYMEAKSMEDSDPEEAKKLLKKIIDSVDPESKRYKKAKELLDKI